MAKSEKAGRATRRKSPKVEQPQRDGAGRPPTYQKAFVSVVREMSAHGCSDFQIGRALGVDRITIWRWRKQHPEFAAASVATDEEKLEAVRGALLSRALGYEHEAVKILSTPFGIEEVPYVEHYPPDVAAMKFYLTNKSAGEFAERQEVEQSGGVTVRVVGGLPDEKEGS